MAIELAATWVRLITPEEILAELTHGLDFLGHNDRAADPRHRSMRTVIDHSWALLSTEAQRVMARLSVFRGGCQRSAAEAVAGATLPILLALVDKSLVQRTTAGRYELHELVRQYAADQLASDPHEEAQVRDNHCTYYAAWTDTTAAQLRSREQRIAVAAMTQEIANVRAAMQYVVTHHKIDVLRLFARRSGLQHFYELRSWNEEAETMFGQVVEMFHASPPTTREEEVLLSTLR